jgi:hypothetical protein
VFRRLTFFDTHQGHGTPKHHAQDSLTHAPPPTMLTPTPYDAAASFAARA